ncbi:orotidine-5'-phosphate decarboxylase [candidate division WOR-3 bacterium]|nr:orotidine-5'-phosphate decarboxylase [candidate division WOR-3 bacterium]
MNVDRAGAVALRDRIGTKVDVYKVGMDMFTTWGPDVVRDFVSRGCRVFLDLKYSDIPTVVGKAVEAASELGVSMLTVHTMGGPKMLSEAAAAADRAKGTKPLVLGVTVLTSLDEAALEKISGSRQTVTDLVRSLALLAKESGCGGAVASPQEIGVVKEACGEDFVVVTPGIRMGARGEGRGTKDDQARTMTPAEAAQAGADYIVVGRPIYEAADPVGAIADIRKQIGG